MADKAGSVPVRCPACRREHVFTPVSFPCPCGKPLSVPVLRGGIPTQVGQRTWQGSWVPLRCPSCARVDDWPQPEMPCPCGVVIRLPVDPMALRPDPPRPAPRPPAAPRPVPRPAFEPLTIRTGDDVLAAAGRYLTWLGFAGVHRAADRTAAGADLCGDGVIARVDPSTAATAAREVETLWLNACDQDVTGVFFSLAGYDREAGQRGGRLVVPLFVMDLTGTPQPVNDAADTLIRTPPSPAAGPAGEHRDGP